MQRLILFNFGSFLSNQYFNNFLITQTKHMLWVLKRTVSMLKLMGKEINACLDVQTWKPPSYLWTFNRATIRERSGSAVECLTQDRGRWKVIKFIIQVSR